MASVAAAAADAKIVSRAADFMAQAIELMLVEKEYLELKNIFKAKGTLASTKLLTCP